VVDNASRKPPLIGRNIYTAESIITEVNEFTAPFNHPVNVEHINIRKIQTDAGTQFTFTIFREACSKARIELFYALSPIDPVTHTDSSHSLNPKSKHHLSAGESMFVKCNAICDRTRPIISRVGQKQK
jgi:hypothetical protein